MIHSESIKELAGALAKAQGAMVAASKDRKNQFGGVYADLGSVIEAAKQPLASNGLSISQHPEIADGRVSVTTILMHASGEWLESSISSTVRDNNALSAAQQAGIVITYLRRYSLASIVGIYADEDTDGSEKPEKKPAAPVAKVTQPAPAREEEIVNELIPPEAPAVVQVPAMSYEEACTITTSDPTPKPYVEIDHATLNNMANSIRKKLLKHGYVTPAEVETAERKLAAILAILAHK